MSYPVLQAAKAYAFVEVRAGHGAAGWKDLQTIHQGPCDAGEEWRGQEGEKLAACHCLWSSDPASTLSQPYIVEGTEGLEVGRAERLRFPSGV